MQVRMGGVKSLLAVLQASTTGRANASGHPAPKRQNADRSEEVLSGPQGLFEDAENQPLLAYTAHTLLGVAEGEAAAGAQGSRALRAAALRALRALLEAADGAALAAILPGTASGLARALQAASEETLPAVAAHPCHACLRKQHASHAICFCISMDDTKHCETSDAFLHLEKISS